MKYTVVIIKISPILLNIYMALTIIFVLFDVDNTPFDTVFGHSLWMDAILYNLSKRFEFCAWHRVLILNLIGVAILSFFLVKYPEMMSSWTAMYLMSGAWIVSAITSTILYFKYGCFKCDN